MQEMPAIVCDFNATGWSGDRGDTYYYVFSQADMAKVDMYEGMKAFIYMYENAEMTEIIGFEAVFEKYGTGWRAKPDEDTFYEGPVFW